VRKKKNEIETILQSQIVELKQSLKKQDKVKQLLDATKKKYNSTIKDLTQKVNFITNKYEKLKKKILFEENKFSHVEKAYKKICQANVDLQKMLNAQRIEFSERQVLYKNHIQYIIQERDELNVVNQELKTKFKAIVPNVVNMP